MYQRADHFLLNWWDPGEKKNRSERVAGDLLAALTRAAARFTATWAHLEGVIEALDAWKERAERAEAQLGAPAAETPSADPCSKA